MFESGWIGLLMGMLVGLGACVDACMRALMWMQECVRLPAWVREGMAALNAILFPQGVSLKGDLKGHLKEYLKGHLMAHQWRLRQEWGLRQEWRLRQAYGLAMPSLLVILGVSMAGCQPPPLSSEMSMGSVRLARYTTLTCGGELPKAPSGMTVARLHECDAIAGLRAQHDDPDSTLTALLAELEQWVILTRTCKQDDGNCFVTQQQLKELKKLGFIDVEEEFRTTSSGRMEPSNQSLIQQKMSQKRALKGEPDRSIASNLSNWHSIQTGARIVVPELLSQLQARATNASTPVYSPRLKVAILDSGIDATALSKRIDATQVSTITHTSAQAVSTNDWNAPGVCVSGVSSCGLKDELGHGTSVADLILAASGGMAEPVSVRVLNAEGSGWASGVASGLTVAVGRFRTPVVNMSLGIQVDSMPRYLTTPLRVLRGFGVRVFTAAGNRHELLVDDGPLYQPAAGGALSATDPYAARAVSVSGVGISGAVSEQVLAKMDQTDPSLFAPSEHICSRTADGARKSLFIAPSGSSFAVAQMSGAMALMMSVQQIASGPGLDLFNAYGAVTRLEAALINDKKRLDYCNAANSLNLNVASCVSWQSQVTIESDECLEPTTVEESVDLNNAPPVAVLAGAGAGVGTILSSNGWQEASDQGVDPVWGVLVSSMPGQGVCDWCTSYSGCRSTDTTMTLVLGEVPCSFSAFQLRVSNPNALPVYLDVDAAVQAVQDQLCANTVSASARVNVSANIAFASGTVLPDATLFLVARDEANLWSGRPVMRTCE